jgi:hypothetical protein
MTGRPDTTQLSVAQLDNYISNYYLNILPEEGHFGDLIAWFEQDTVDGLGEYTFSSPMRVILPPMTADDGSNETPIVMWFDEQYFFALYPEEATPSEGKPIDALISGGQLWLRPVPDAAYTIKVPALKIPDSMTVLPTANPADTPEQNIWGNLIALGAALECFRDNGEFEEIKNHMPFYKYYLRLAKRRRIVQFSAVGTRSAPKW